MEILITECKNLTGILKYIDIYHILLSVIFSFRIQLLLGLHVDYAVLDPVS